MDREAVDLRLPHQPALHAQENPLGARRPRRLRRLLPARRTATSASRPSGSSAFTYDELIARDKVNLDIIWLRDESLEDIDNLPAPEVIAAEIVEDLQAALDQFAAIAASLGTSSEGARLPGRGGSELLGAGAAGDGPAIVGGPLAGAGVRAGAGVVALVAAQAVQDQKCHGGCATSHLITGDPNLATARHQPTHPGTRSPVLPALTQIIGRSGPAARTDAGRTAIHGRPRVRQPQRPLRALALQNDNLGDDLQGLGITAGQCFQQFRRDPALPFLAGRNAVTLHCASPPLQREDGGQ